MPVPPEVFDDDYLYFYDELLGTDRADADAEVVAGLLGLEQVPGDELAARLERAGFASVRLFGAGGGQFLPEGPRLIALAVR